MLLISNSTNAGEDYLDWPKQYIKDFLEKTGVKRVLFIPYAGVALSEESVEDSYEVYEERVNGVFNELGFEVYSIHREKNPAEAIKDALAIAVGGGNTFHLVYMLHELRLMKPLREAVENGLPYMGWSAGSNIVCPTMRTTNDMPIIEPESLNCLNLIPFQINPHYLDANPEGHGGETREQRINEFLEVNPGLYVAGLREGTMLLLEDNNLKLIGPRDMRIFRKGDTPYEVSTDRDLSFLI